MNEDQRWRLKCYLVQLVRDAKNLFEQLNEIKLVSSKINLI